MKTIIRNPSALSSFLAFGVVGAAICTFTTLSILQLDLPGLNYDEAVEVVPSMQMLLGLDVKCFRDFGFTIIGHRFPIMTQDYIGAHNTYLAIPFLLTVGHTVYAIRLMPIFCGAIALLLIYIVARELYGRRVGFMAVCFLAINPSYIFLCRQGIFVSSITILITFAALWCWLQWLKSGRRCYAGFGGFWIGLGLYVCAIFIWVIVAFIASIPLIRDKSRFRDARALHFALIAFAYGILPLIIYNNHTGGIISSISRYFTVSYDGPHNFVSNFITRLTQFTALLDGSHLWYIGDRIHTFLLPVAFWICILVLPLLTIKLGKTWLRRALFPFLVTGVIVVASCFTISGLWVEQLTILIPWPILAVCIVVDGLLQIAEERAARMNKLQAPSQRTGPNSYRLLFLFCALVAIDNLSSDACYHLALRESGGRGPHSDAIYQLSRYLDNKGYTAPVVLDWGIAAQVEFLTSGHVRPVEIFGYEWNTDPGFATRLAPFIMNTNNVYLFRCPSDTIFNRREAFDRIIRKSGMSLQTEAEFRQRNGDPLFIIQRLVIRP